MTTADISRIMEEYVANNEMSGGALIVRKNDKIVYQNRWGYANLETKEKISDRSIYRWMSMTKCVVGAAVMKLIEEGKIGLDDPVSKYLPEFSNMRAADDPRYDFVLHHNTKHLKWKVLTFHMNRVKTVPAKREITIRDLLSHSSGLGQGTVGRLEYMKMKDADRTLEERVKRYSKYVLGFQPGCGTGYSIIAGFDVLGYIIQKISGMTFGEYLKKEIFEPLGMDSACFFLSEEQEKHLVRIYKRKDGRLIDVSGTKEDNIYAMRQGKYRFEGGCGGLFGTTADYEKFARMLCNGGCCDGVQILKPESVKLMHTEAPEMHLEPEPGMVWGLSVKIRQDPKKAKSYAHKGTYGWSGAFGTHYFVCPDEHLEAVFMTNRSNAGGSGSKIVRKVEELVFDLWGEKQSEMENS